MEGYFWPQKNAKIFTGENFAKKASNKEKKMMTELIKSRFGKSFARSSMKKIFILTSLLMLPLVCKINAASLTWDDTRSRDALWGNTVNWTPALLPGGTDDVHIAHSSGQLVILGDVSYSDISPTINSLTFNSGLGTFDVMSMGSTSVLTVNNGGITNSDAVLHSFISQVNAGANADYNTGTAGLTFSNLSVGANHITVSGTGQLTVTKSLDIDINSLVDYGTIGVITVTAGSGRTTVNVGGTYTGNVGDVFDLTSGSFADAALGSLPTLTTGKWDSSQFLSQGILTVAAVPEPSTYALVFFGFWGLCLVAKRKKKH